MLRGLTMFAAALLVYLEFEMSDALREREEELKAERATRREIEETTYGLVDHLRFIAAHEPEAYKRADEKWVAELRSQSEAEAAGVET